jgi:hypothetical protein
LHGRADGITSQQVDIQKESIISPSGTKALSALLSRVEVLVKLLGGSVPLIVNVTSGAHHM